MKKTCLTCGREVNGRTDKKFCNEACKNDFHNRKPKIPGITVYSSFNGSYKNREILKSLAMEGVSKIESHELEYNGFDFKSITGIEFLKRGGVKLYCHEYKLLKTGNAFRIQIPE